MAKKSGGTSGDNPNSRAALEAAREATQFGAENGNKRSQDGGNKPWSIRTSLRSMARVPLKKADAKLSEADIIDKLLPDDCTPAQIQAARSLAKGMAGDSGSISYNTDQIDGKLAQTNINADVAAILGMSDDELDKYIAGFGTNPKTSDGDSNGGKGTAPGS